MHLGKPLLKGRLLILLTAAVGTLGTGRPLIGAGYGEQLPPFELVEQTLLAWFQAGSDYQPGNIITRPDGTTVFAQIEKIGWQVNDRGEILDSMLPDEDFLVRQLRTDRGRKFMARVAGLPHAYDRLAHLARLPQGQRTVRDLIHAKGGAELIEYLATAPGGREMGRMLSKAPGGKGFNKPTGCIYTTGQLLARLKTSYAAESTSGSKKRASPAANP